MATFIKELWELVLTPGTTPALIKATHGLFIMLIVSLVVLVATTRSIHFINLLVIATLLYGTVVWFIGELEQLKEAKRKEEEKEKKETAGEEVEKISEEKAKEKGTATGLESIIPREVKTKSKKV